MAIDQGRIGLDGVNKSNSMKIDGHPFPQVNMVVAHRLLVLILKRVDLTMKLLLPSNQGGSRHRCCLKSTREGVSSGVGKKKRSIGVNVDIKKKGIGTVEAEGSHRMITGSALSSFIAGMKVSDCLQLTATHGAMADG